MCFFCSLSSWVSMMLMDSFNAFELFGKSYDFPFKFCFLGSIEVTHLENTHIGSVDLMGGMLSWPFMLVLIL